MNLGSRSGRGFERRKPRGERKSRGRREVLRHEIIIMQVVKMVHVFTHAMIHLAQ